MPAALDGAGEKLQGVGCRVWSANLYLHARKVVDLKPMSQAACNDFNKKMYQHGPGVSTGFCGLHHVGRDAEHARKAKGSLNVHHDLNVSHQHRNHLQTVVHWPICIDVAAQHPVWCAVRIWVQHRYMEWSAASWCFGSIWRSAHRHLHFCFFHCGFWLRSCIRAVVVFEIQANYHCGERQFAGCSKLTPNPSFQRTAFGGR